MRNHCDNCGEHLWKPEWERVRAVNMPSRWRVDSTGAKTLVLGWWTYILCEKCIERVEELAKYEGDE